ncbi:hypothetical protein D1970_15685 [Mesobacillus zeae]|uniref:Uncharacterized protein n=1 Tax=Mesobacillus zeae TaxID=1917180 RepID=A0A398B6W9_9BACI|nr:hypothetical protein D1970_15685 [Mesobacillus zeae]
MVQMAGNGWAGDTSAMWCRWVETIGPGISRLAGNGWAGDISAGGQERCDWAWLAGGPQLSAEVVGD